MQKRMTSERVNGIKSGYWSPARKEELVQRLAEYENIGTVENCREAVEKQKPMKIKEIHVDEYYCPACGAENNCDQGIARDKFCPVCGQKLKQED